MLEEKILSAISSALPQSIGKNPTPVSLHEPAFLGNEWVYVKDCLDSGWVSSVGTYVDRFEQMLTDITGIHYAIAVVNGTAALHVCLKLLGVQAGDEVLVPTLTFVATANAVDYCQATCHFVDAEGSTLGVDANKLERYLSETTHINQGACFNSNTGRQIKALIAMHTFGHPADIERLSAVCASFKIELVEDAAESLGSYYSGKHTGHWGRVSSLSFNGNKTITTGGGGAILTNDPKLAAFAKHITTTAKVPHQWAFVHDQIGFNYRLPNLNAALGCAQLEQLPMFLQQKRALAEFYKNEFEKVEGVSFFSEPKFSKSNYWLNAIILDQTFAFQRDRVIKFLHENCILARPAWTLMHQLQMFQDCPKMDLSCAENIESRLINIPSSAKLGKWVNDLHKKQEVSRA